MKKQAKQPAAKVGKATPAKVTPKAAAKGKNVGTAAKKSATASKSQQGAKKPSKATAAKKSRKG